MEREIALLPPPEAGGFAPPRKAAGREKETAATGLSLDRAVLDVRRMTEADRLTIASGTTTIELMENAGRAMAREIRQRWSPGRITVFGPGLTAEDLPDLLPVVFRRLDTLRNASCLPDGIRSFQPDLHCARIGNHQTLCMRWC